MRNYFLDEERIKITYTNYDIWFEYRQSDGRMCSMRFNNKEQMLKYLKNSCDYYGQEARQEILLHLQLLEEEKLQKIKAKEEIRMLKKELGMM